jgi:DNA-binding NtrC family response regulator
MRLAQFLQKHVRTHLSSSLQACQINFSSLLGSSFGRGDKMKYEKRTILIVDDEDVVLDVQGLMLQKMGFNILKANSSAKAYRLYENKKDEIDLVILDMIMPGDNGAVTYKKLKMINPALKVLISSGFWKDLNVRAILSDGKNSFIQKPFKYAEFNKKVNSMLAA